MKNKKRSKESASWQKYLKKVFKVIRKSIPDKKFLNSILLSVGLSLVSTTIKFGDLTINF